MSGPFNASEITGGSYEGVFVARDRDGGFRPGQKRLSFVRGGRRKEPTADVRAIYAIASA